MSKLCEMCRQKPPSCLVGDHDGLIHNICKKCQPSFTTNAVLAELEVIKLHLEKKLYQYELFKKNHVGADLYRASRSFQEDFKTMIVRLQQLITIKHYGRQPKNKIGIIDSSYPIAPPPKSKPTPKSTIKPKSKPKRHHKAKKGAIKAPLSPKKPHKAIKTPPKAKNNKHKVKVSKKPNVKSPRSKRAKTNHKTK